ncbi:MAG TPA: Ig-like domain-containing protein, partial [Polyangiaceae bacterium]|nr:Ig-like domain-containing protein [Polyangiaceae bacterium]
MPRTDLRSRPILAALAAVAIGAACFPGAGPVSPKAGTAKGGEADAFGVAFAAPRGESTAAGEITLVMNKPMRSLELAGDEAPPFATLSPKVRGSWQWVGTSGLLFVPEGRLPKATAFVVEIPAGTKALDGSALAKPFRMDLSTERPGVVEINPRDGSKGIPLDAAFTVRFNQPIEPH